MATYKILYWQDIPSQIRVEDEQGGEVSIELPQKFAEKIDQAATQQDLLNSDDYLDHWKWSDEQDRPGTAQQVADALQAELEAKWR